MLLKLAACVCVCVWLQMHSWCLSAVLHAYDGRCGGDLRHTGVYVVYGFSTDAFDTPESHKAFALSLLHLYIQAYGKSWGLARFVKMVEPDGKGMLTLDSIRYHTVRTLHRRQ